MNPVDLIVDAVLALAGWLASRRRRALRREMAWRAAYVDQQERRRAP